MNIGIVGLLPEQVRLVQQEFPQHALRFLSKDNESETIQFAKGCDKVVMMTNFIGHHIQDRVPQPKRVFVTGGMTKLKNTLKTLPAAIGQPPMPSPATTAAKSAKPAPEYADLVDWSALDNANVGEEIRIARPPRVSLKLFNMRVTAGRSYRKSHMGIVTTPHRIVDGFAVMKVKEKTAPTKGKHVAALETPPSQPTPEPTAETAPMQQVITLRDTQQQATVSLANPRESAFWQSVFVETLKQWPGAPITTIATRADEAMQAYACRAVSAVNASH